MNILEQTDSQILQIAEPMWDDIVKGGNSKNWDVFSQYLPQEKATEETKKDVLKQWENVPELTSLTTNREFITILRKDDCVVVLWKQWSTKVEGDFLGRLYLKSIDSEVKSVSILIS